MSTKVRQDDRLYPLGCWNTISLCAGPVRCVSGDKYLSWQPLVLSAPSTIWKAPAWIGYICKAPAWNGYICLAPAWNGYICQAPAWNCYICQAPAWNCYICQAPAWNGYICQAPLETFDVSWIWLENYAIF